MLSGGYRFNVGSSVYAYRKIHGHGRRAPRQPLRNIQGTLQYRAITQPSDNVSTTSAVNAGGQRTAYQVYCSICRRYVPENQNHRCERPAIDNNNANNAVTVAAPVMAQQAHSRSRSNTASTSVTVNGNNNSTVVGDNVPALHQS